jgi:hypothetical protein
MAELVDPSARLVNYRITGALFDKPSPRVIAYPNPTLVTRHSLFVTLMIPQPLSLREIALVSAPGLLITLASAFAGMPVALFLGTIAALGLAALVLAVARRSLAAFPVWGILPLGFLSFLAASGLGMLSRYNLEIILPVAALVTVVAALGLVWRRERPGLPPAASGWLLVIALAACVMQVLPVGEYSFYSSPADWSFLALPAAAGLVLAPVHGLRAVWLLLPAGTFLMSFDIEHVIYFWDAPGWSDAIKTAMPVLFLIVTPVWMAVARDRRLQTAGLVVPPLFYWLLLVIGLGTVSFVAPDWAHVLRIARPVFALIAGLAFFGAFCVWLEQGSET